jgi:hypothetical protein
MLLSERISYFIIFSPGIIFLAIIPFLENQQIINPSPKSRQKNHLSGEILCVTANNSNVLPSYELLKIIQFR